MRTGGEFLYKGMSKHSYPQPCGKLLAWLRKFVSMNLHYGSQEMLNRSGESLLKSNTNLTAPSVRFSQSHSQTFHKSSATIMQKNSVINVRCSSYATTTQSLMMRHGVSGVVSTLLMQHNTYRSRFVPITRGTKKITTRQDNRLDQASSLCGDRPGSIFSREHVLCQRCDSNLRNLPSLGSMLYRSFGHGRSSRSLGWS